MCEEAAGFRKNVSEEIRVRVDAFGKSVVQLRSANMFLAAGRKIVREELRARTGDTAMDLFSHAEFDHHEDVRFLHHRESGLRAIIALHDTTLGPAIGGCRMWPYASDGEALADVLRLSRGMTYKTAMAGLPFGGGKSVIIGDPRRDKSPELWRAFGRAVEGFGGRYYTGEDVGTTPADMDLAGGVTRFVLGRASGGSGDPSPMTARGVLAGIRVAVRHRLGRDGLAGITVALQGLGHVGMHLAELLAMEGARLVVADLDPGRAGEAARRFGARVVSGAEILETPCEVLAPCALGAVIDDHSLPRLRCAVVAGAANNQLATERHGDGLHERRILYAPDYVINAGGVINIAEELHPEGYRPERARQRLEVIGERLTEIFARAARREVPTHRVADAMAREIVARARRARAA